MHDGASHVAYSAVRLIGAVLGSIASEIAPIVVPLSSASIGGRPRSNRALATLNAAIGDRLAADEDPLAIAMSVRLNGCDVDVTATALSAAFPRATSRLAVFVHGLAETEDDWNFGGGTDRPAYGQRLSDDFGFSSVYLRYNSGRHISENGRDLVDLLDHVVAAWPVRVEELLLVGHSMGGLVIRSACYYGEIATARFVPLVRHVVLLGSPQLGAPLARFAHIAGWALRRSEEPLPFSPVLTTRSAGIDDLRYGYLLEEDWSGCDTSWCRENHRRDVPLLSTAEHLTISFTVTRSTDGPLARLVGDLLVQPASAHGQPVGADSQAPAPRAGVGEFGGRHHLQLLNDDYVYGAIREQLEASDARRRTLGASREEGCDGQQVAQEAKSEEARQDTEGEAGSQEGQDRTLRRAASCPPHR